MSFPGNQGGSVARSLAKNKAFHVRGITRNPESEKARELSGLGVEIVQADGWNKEQMLKAFKGSWGAFVNTNTEDPVSVTLISMTAPLRDQLVGDVSAAKAKELESRISTLPAIKSTDVCGF